MTDRTLTLPWPPSVNTYWRAHARASKTGPVAVTNILSKRGRQYRADVLSRLSLQGWPILEGRLRVLITAWPPDKRRRDLDNLLKPVLDALEHAAVYADDEQIDELTIIRGPVKKPGYCRIVIESIP